MIKYIKRKNLNIEKYNSCIENSTQSKIYGFSWYLDIVADNWDVLVLDDYAAVMPIPWRKKLGITYVYPPFWMLELGIFSANKTINENDFLKVLFRKFRFVESRMNSKNSLSGFLKYCIQREYQFLDLKNDYESISNNFKKDRKKDLKRAKEFSLTKKWNNNSQELISLFKNNVGQRVSKITEEDYVILSTLIAECLERKLGEVLSIYQEDKLIAAAFLIKHKKEITILISSTDFENRKNGANTFLIDKAIQKYKTDFNTFNFGGSSIKSVAKYFKSFGALTKSYPQIKYNNLPKLLRFFKQ